MENKEHDEFSFDFTPKKQHNKTNAIIIIISLIFTWYAFEKIEEIGLGMLKRTNEVTKIFNQRQTIANQSKNKNIKRIKLESNKPKLIKFKKKKNIDRLKSKICKNGKSIEYYERKTYKCTSKNKCAYTGNIEVRKYGYC